MGRFETKLLSTNENLPALADLCGSWIDKIHGKKPLKTIVLDVDSSVSPTQGAQEGTAYNGHFSCSCYHPLFVFNQSAISNAARCVPAMFTAPMIGKTCWSRLSPAIKAAG